MLFNEVGGRSIELVTVTLQPIFGGVLAVAYSDGSSLKRASIDSITQMKIQVAKNSLFVVTEGESLYFSGDIKPLDRTKDNKGWYVFGEGTLIDATSVPS